MKLPHLHTPQLYWSEVVMAFWLVLLAVLLFGCSPGSKRLAKPDSAPLGTAESTASLAKDSDSAAASLQYSAAALQDSAMKVGTLATAVEAKSPVVAKEVAALRKEAGAVSTEAVEVDTVAKDITALASRLRETKALVAQLEAGIKQRDADIDKLDEELFTAAEQIAKANDKTQSALKRLLMFAIIAGLLAVAISATLVVNGNGKAVGIGVGGAVLSLASLGFSVFLAHLAWVAFGAVVIVVGLVTWKIYEKRRDDRATYELVKSVERVKNELPADAKVKLFGDTIGDGEVGQLQSSGTKARVRELRKQLREATRSLAC